MIPLGQCDCCNIKPAVNHITMRVEVVTPKRKKIKIVQFALCEDCEKNQQAIFMQTSGLENRVAQRLSLLEGDSWKATRGRW